MNHTSKTAAKLIRPRPADLPALTALEATLFKTDRLSKRQMRAHIDNPRAFFRIARAPAQQSAAQDGGGIHGPSGSIHGYVLTLYRGPYARLYSIALAPAAQGQGLGRKMLDAALRDARARGCTKIGLEVSVKNKRALALYKQNGFMPMMHLPAYYGDGSDGIRMIRTL